VEFDGFDFAPGFPWFFDRFIRGLTCRTRLFANRMIAKRVSGSWVMFLAVRTLYHSNPQYKSFYLNPSPALPRQAASPSRLAFCFILSPSPAPSLGNRFAFPGRDFGGLDDHFRGVTKMIVFSSLPHGVWGGRNVILVCRCRL
jgi:hypothetical protein